ncbi:MAG: hypothetical protein J6V72_02600 [Kiritimatiellae bacterium]|nr:hypothetical protein [Kiritimatiellia bacterium]
MAYLAKKAVLDGIKSRVVKHSDGDYTIFEAYLGTDMYSKKAARLASTSEQKLRKKVEDFYRRLSVGGDAAVVLTPYQSLDAKNALDMLAKAGLNIPLSECVRRVLESAESEKPCTTTLREAYEAYLKTQEGKSHDHQRTVRTRVGKFVETFGADRLLSEVTAKEANANLEARYYNPKDPKTKTTYNNCLGYVKTFFEWCTKESQGYISKNPLSSIEPKTKAYVRPEYMTSADVEKLFRVLEARKTEAPADLADAILSFFCGVRQSEINRIPSGAKAVEIDLEEGYMTIFEVKGHLRGIMPRSFTIPAQALAWMKSMPDFVGAARTQNNKFREHLVDAAKEAGVKLPENAGRHTFCTMFEAAHHDSNALSAIVGNSEDVRKHHYNGVAKPQDGRSYFAIMPGETGNLPPELSQNS